MNINDGHAERMKQISDEHSRSYARAMRKVYAVAFGILILGILCCTGIGLVAFAQAQRATAMWCRAHAYADVQCASVEAADRAPR